MAERRYNRIAVLKGGWSPEREVSLVSGAAARPAATGFRSMYAQVASRASSSRIAIVVELSRAPGSRDDGAAISVTAPVVEETAA